MHRFILRYRGPGAKPAADVEHVRNLEGAKVLDDSSPRMLLVEAPEETLRGAVASLRDWMVAPEQTYAAPRPSPILEAARDLKPPK
jgi:hypothetical protein